MDSYFQKVVMPDGNFRIISNISRSYKHDIEVHPHWHSEVEILYCVNGFAKQQVNEDFFIMRQGDMVIINKEQIHSTYSYNGRDCEILVVLFDASLFWEEGDIGQVIYNNTTKIKNPIHFNEAKNNPAYDCLMGIYEELLKKEEGYQFFVRSYINTITGLVKRQGLYEICRDNENNVLLVKQMLRKTFSLIDECYSKDISLDKAAAASNLSVPHFCRLFRKATGMSFNEYLMYYRVKRAEKMLNSTKKMTDIALECGFGSISSFTRCFKKFKMCTPSEYKKRLSLASVNNDFQHPRRQ